MGMNELERKMKNMITLKQITISNKRDMNNNSSHKVKSTNSIHIATHIIFKLKSSKVEKQLNIQIHSTATNSD